MILIDEMRIILTIDHMILIDQKRIIKYILIKHQFLKLSCETMIFIAPKERVSLKKNKE